MRLPLLTAGMLAVTTICAGSRALAQEEPPPPPHEPPPPPPPGERPQEEPPPAPPKERPQEEPAPPPPKERPQEEPPPVPPQPPGEEQKAPPVPGDDATDPDFQGFSMGDDLEQVEVGNERVLAAAGTERHPLLIRLRGFEVRCQGLVMWGDRDRVVDAVERRREVLADPDPDALLGPVIHALYAEGGVYVKLKDHEIHAASVFLDFERGQAYLVRATLNGKLEGPNGRTLPLSLRADVIRATARNHYRAEDARLTTCPYSDPHYSFTADWIEVDYRGGGASTFETAWWPTLRADTILGKDTPVFVMPKLGGDSWFSNMPVQGASLAHGSRMGTSVLLGWGGNLQREDGSRWGDWRLHTDYRSERGPGVGADVSHTALPTTPGGHRDQLDVSGYWQQDDNEFDQFSDRAFDGGLDPSGNDPNRGFAHLFHRWYVEDPTLTSVAGDGWRVDTEASWFSDRGYFAEYDRQKAETAKQQETYLEARKTWGNEGVSLLGSYRLTDDAAYLNRKQTDLVTTDFAVQTDYLPSASYHMIGQPVLSAERTGAFPLVLSMEASAANVERRYDEQLAHRIEADSGWTSEQVQRGDLETRVNAPFSLCDVHVNPAFGGSLYGVSDANGFPPNGDGSDVRYAGFWGVRADTQAWKTFPDAKSAFLDLDGMRHVISLDTQYFDRFKVSDPSESYQSNDLVDVLAETRVGSVRVRNRLQTRRDGEQVDWLDVESRFLYFFDHNAPAYPGLFGVREDFPHPLQDLDFPGESKYTRFERDGSAFWQHRGRMQMLSNLWLFGEADYDMQANAMETSAVGARWFADQRLSLYAGRRTIHSDSTIWTERLDYRLSNRWGVEVEYQSDSKTGRGLSTAVSLYRRAHDYTIAIEVSSDKQGGDTSVGLAIYPNDWAGGNKDPFSLRRPLDVDALKWYR
jgi:hypothetical protein